MAGRTPLKYLYYNFLQLSCRLLGAALLDIRVSGRQHVPPTGGALVLSNHQSFFDPLLLGLAADRDMFFLARDTLFRSAPLRLALWAVDTIPLDREGGGLSGLKETLRRVREGSAVAIFPEGTRTPDGDLQKIKPGFCALARRARAPLVPVAIDGAYQAWPRKQKLPRRATVHIVFGPPIAPEQAQALDDAALVAEVQQRIGDCLATARAGRHRASCVHA
ncbi:MAG: 1-acyl-sn-glycerol-3-phosphate acyltransferase [Planctomycetes bacterium]|nr:1-acyl-sn-glycerol-3-phosphate acyltransferase [Planctomycetota bacterium]